jgi:DNA polymerase-3 subunit beta
MEFTVSKAGLLKELELAESVVEKKTTIPILANILLDDQGGKLLLSATDLELALRSECEFQPLTAGATTVPGKRLVEIVRSLADAQIRIKVLENHWVEITCERSFFKLAGMSKENFPALPEAPKAQAEFPAAALSSLITRTSFAIANEESRYTLNGALMVLKPDKIMMVATDGHRLAQVERETPVEGLNNELRVLIPKKAMGEIHKVLEHSDAEEKLKFAKDENHLFFNVGSRLLTSRVLTGQFPNYDAVLPRDNNRIIILDRADFTNAIKRVALMADPRTRAIRLQIESGKMEIFSVSSEQGEAHQALDAEYEGEKMQIGFNYQYLLDFLGALEGETKVRLELKDEQSAGQLRPVDEERFRYRYVVMPMRV